MIAILSTSGVVSRTGEEIDVNSGRAESDGNHLTRERVGSRTSIGDSGQCVYV